MSRVAITRRVRFEAAHQLWSTGLDEAANEATYGKCAREGGHGHNYEVEVTVEVALQYNDSYNEAVYAFANNINTVEGGSHLVGFRTALTRSINRYLSNHNKNSKGEAPSVTGDDLREGGEVPLPLGADAGDDADAAARLHLHPGPLVGADAGAFDVTNDADAAAPSIGVLRTVLEVAIAEQRKPESFDISPAVVPHQLVAEQPLSRHVDEGAVFGNRILTNPPFHQHAVEHR